MTWSEFTAYLDGTRPIRKAERDELFDNLDDLLTGACAAAGYALNGTAMTAIKTSRLRTDLASLDGPGATNTTGRLHAVLEAASEAFVNYDDAVAAALTAEGITSTERDAVIAARLDDARLWNYYRRVIDALECCTPPNTPDQSATGYKREYFSRVIATAGTSPYTFAASGLPPGLSLNSSTGEINGTPTTAGTYSVAVSVENDCGIDTATLTITISERCNYSYADAGSNGAGGIDNQVIYDITVDVSGYFGPGYWMNFSWTSTGFVAPGFGIAITTESAGVISGSATSASGTTRVFIPAGTTSLRFEASSTEPMTVAFTFTCDD